MRLSCQFIKEPQPVYDKCTGRSWIEGFALGTDLGILPQLLPLDASYLGMPSHLKETQNHLM